MRKDLAPPDLSVHEEEFSASRFPSGSTAVTGTASTLEEMGELARCQSIIMDNPEIRSCELKSAIARLDSEGVAIMRICNPLTVPLTSRRICIQLDF